MGEQPPSCPPVSYSYGGFQRFDPVDRQNFSIIIQEHLIQHQP